MVEVLRRVFRHIEAIADVGFMDTRTAYVLDAIKTDFRRTPSTEPRTVAPAWLSEIFVIVAQSGDAGVEKLCRYAALSFPLKRQADLIHTMRDIEGDFLHIPRNATRDIEPLHTTMQTFLIQSHHGRRRERLIRFLERGK